MWIFRAMESMSMHCPGKSYNYWDQVAEPTTFGWPENGEQRLVDQQVGPRQELNIHT